MSTFNEMVDFLDMAWPAKDQVVPCLIGPTGIGKTQAVLQHAQNVKAGKVVTIIASQILPNEVSGITMPVAETRAMEIYDHYKLSSLEDGDILFFDELLEADQLVLSACLTLIESRQMMSGKLLPDIQIVAATNPSITPVMLKENIKQRFLFRQFELDRLGCRDHISDTYGVDIGDGLMNLLEEENSKSYNVLTQRTMTKMVHWMCSAEDDLDEAKLIGNQIDKIMQSPVGNMLYKRYRQKYAGSPEDSLRKMVKNSENLVAEIGYHDDMDLGELIEKLTSLPNWDELQHELAAMEIPDELHEEEPQF